MKKNIKLFIDEKNEKKLNEIKQKTNIPITRIINILISELEEEKELITDIVDDYETEVRFKITAYEKEFLKKQALKNGTETITTEIKYRLLNSMYKNAIFTPKEKQELSKARYELNMIGLNLNQLLKQIYTKDDYRIDKDEIKGLILQLTEKIKVLKDEWNNYIQFADKRI